MLFFIFCAPWETSAAEKKKDFVGMYEVPTTGKIIDVEYRPEFEEWWVKCREGDSIVVYSYDKRGHKWGKIVFVPKKTGEQTQGTDRTKPAASGEPPPTGVKDGKAEDIGKPKAKKSDKPAWWDPLNLLKGGEKLIAPPPSESR